MKPKKFDKITVLESGLISGITRRTEIPAEALALAEFNMESPKQAKWKVFKCKRSARGKKIRGPVDYRSIKVVMEK